MYLSSTVCFQRLPAPRLRFCPCRMNFAVRIVKKLLRTSDDKAGAAAKCPDCGSPARVPMSSLEEDDGGGSLSDFDAADGHHFAAYRPQRCRYGDDGLPEQPAKSTTESCPCVERMSTRPLSPAATVAKTSKTNRGAANTARRKWTPARSCRQPRRSSKPRCDGVSAAWWFSS